MRLLTHNMLSCNIKGVTNGFPLKLVAEKWVTKEVDLNADFLRGVFPKIEWPALVAAARALDYSELPEEADSSMLASDDFLQRFHHALLELHVEEGALVCPETGRKFPINKGIPNMLLHEDEVKKVIRKKTQLNKIVWSRSIYGTCEIPPGEPASSGFRRISNALTSKSSMYAILSKFNS